MTNSDKLHEMALIDALYILNGKESPKGCIIENAAGHKKCRDINCYGCLQRWLREESK